MSRKSQLLGHLLTGIAVIAGAGAAEAQQAAADNEIVVTGSFIKRSEGFPSASPVDVLSAQDLALRAPTNLSNFFADLPSNFGSTFSTGRANGGGERGLGTINLRGLGNASTLVLLNGHRQTQVPDSPTNVIDTNSLVPDIMIERFEVLKDGASALYGTDAVAGVVNIITRDRFSGLRLSVAGSNFDYSDKGDRNIQIMGGSDIGGKGHIVAAFAYTENDLMTSLYDSPATHRDDGNLRITIDAYNPGSAIVPLRGPTGALLTGAGSTASRVDPTCGTILGTTPTRGRTTTTLPVATPLATANTCTASFYDDNALQSGLQRFQGFARGTYEFTDNLKFTGEVGFTNFNTETTYTAGETLAVNVLVPGHNPGAQYVARDSAGNQLYAQSSGVAAGYSRDGAAVFLPLRNAAGVVQLSATPTVAASGIPFYEDVTIAAAGSRLLGSQCGLPTGNTMPLGACAASRPTKSDDNVINAAGYLDGTIFSDWDWKAGLSYSKYNITTNNTPGMGLTSELFRAVDGLGGAACAVPNGITTAPARGTSTCRYFNPFGNSAFATGAGDPKANSQAIIDYVLPLLTDRYESKLLVADVQISGALAELPAGPLAIAAGAQYRKSDLLGDYDVNRNAGNTTNLNSASDFTAQTDANAVFGEVNVPILKNDLGYVEVDAAVRYEKIGDLDSTNPKVGLLYNSNNEMVTLRASYGTSFVAPSLFQQFGNVGGGGALTDCPVTLNPVCTGATNLRITQVTTGNPNLRPQTSDAYSFGATVRPFDGFRASIDRWNYSFEDLITTQSANAVVLLDPTGALGQVVRNSATNAVALVRVQYTNAPAVETSGYDFSAGYKRELGGFGNIDLDVSGTYRDKYQVQQVAGGVFVDGLGQTNGGGGRAPLAPNPKWRTNARATWSTGPHSLTTLLHYYGELTMSETPTVTVKSWLPVDLSYSYNMGGEDGEGILKGASFTIGSTNIFDTLAPYVPYPGFQPFLPTLHDIRGRSVYARVSMDF